MNHIHHFAISDIMPARTAILRAQGMNPDDHIPPRIAESLDAAVELFSDLATPVSIMSDITRADFAAVYEGLGRNESPSPIEEVYRQGDHLAIFAATVGPAVCDRISALFRANEFVIGGLLDTIASEGTDRISRRLEGMFAERFATDPGSCVFAYSPGYCGWHISAQRVLFDVLHPEKIGITLRDSFLMEPLKSISGVLVAGPKEIHRIENIYGFCADCRSQACLARRSIVDGS